MEILIIGYFEDLQTAAYIANSFYELGHNVEGISSRKIVMELGFEEGQKRILEEIENYSKELTPDLVLVLKGSEMSFETLKTIKEKFNKAIFVNWFFDVYFNDKKIWEKTDYFKTIKLFDYYFCSLKGVADKLKEVGLDNVYFLDEACYPPENGEVYMNWAQEKKYGEDVAFVGTLGLKDIHKQRIEILDKLATEGFRMKIWGNVVGSWKEIGEAIAEHHTGASVINKEHSMVCQASKVVLGVDQDRNIEMGHSARLFRVLAAGGTYLLNATKGVEKLFRVNEDGKNLTGDEELVFYYSFEDLVNKIDFLLEHDDIRKKIGENGKKKVLEKHKFTDRIKEMLEVIEVK